MKKIYKKNIYMFIIAIITVFFGCSNVKANDTFCTESKLKTCYYKNPDDQLELRIKVVFYKSNEGLSGIPSYECASEGFINFFNYKAEGGNATDVRNLYDSASLSPYRIEPLYNSWEEAKKKIKESCPKYIVVIDPGPGEVYRTYATNNENVVKEWTEMYSRFYTVRYASNLNSEGKPISKKEYYSDLVPDYKGEEVDVDCKTLFDSKDENNPNAKSIREIFNEIMLYPRIGVPILIILLGIIDFAKAVMTSKEDEMKASQNKFVKRLIIGIAIFFIPTLVNLIMDLANYIWNPDYVESICEM